MTIKGIIKQRDETKTIAEAKTRSKHQPNPPIIISITTKRLSGLSWTRAFPTSTNTTDLEDGFRENVENFITALRNAGATVSISATYRPAERAYLMHYSYRIGEEGLDPRTVPENKDVDIEWVHKTNDKPDLALSKRAAHQMVLGYDIEYRPSLTSRHTTRNAIDMSISWVGNLKIIDANGKEILIKTGRKDGLNPKLIEVGASYGVIKHLTDRPHWSTDGR